MDFLELAKRRYSVRKFDDRKIETDKIKLILEAGRVAPTAANYQPQRILVLDNVESLDKLKKCTSYHFNAPLAMIVCYDNKVSWKRVQDEKEMGEVDASIVTTHMMLEIDNLGLGTTWVASFDPAAIQSLFSLPSNIIPVAILPIGYPSADSKAHAWHYQRLSETETIFYNKF